MLLTLLSLLLLLCTRYRTAEAQREVQRTIYLIFLLIIPSTWSHYCWVTAWVCYQSSQSYLIFLLIPSVYHRSHSSLSTNRGRGNIEFFFISSFVVMLWIRYSLFMSLMSVRISAEAHSNCPQWSLVHLCLHSTVCTRVQCQPPDSWSS